MGLKKLEMLLNALLMVLPTLIRVSETQVVKLLKKPVNVPLELSILLS